MRRYLEVTYKEKCAKLAALYQEASITGRKFQCLYHNGYWKDAEFTPNNGNDLSMWRIKPKENTLEKYISLGLDMEFSGDGNSCIDMLICLPSSSNKFYRSNKQGSWSNCRLRPDHVHWWNGKSHINPIPEDCEYNYYLKNGKCYGWYPATQAKNHKWNNILAFEIRYI